MSADAESPRRRWLRRFAGWRRLTRVRYALAATSPSRSQPSPHRRQLPSHSGGLLVLDRRARSVRGDGRTGHRAPRVLRRMARGRPRRVPRAAMRAATRRSANAVSRRSRPRSASAITGPRSFDETLRVWARCGDVRGARFTYEYRDRARRRARGGRLLEARRGRPRDLSPDARARLARRGDRYGRGVAGVVVVSVVDSSFGAGVAFFGLATTFVPTRTTRVSPS